MLDLLVLFHVLFGAIVIVGERYIGLLVEFLNFIYYLQSFITFSLEPFLNCN